MEKRSRNTLIIIIIIIMIIIIIIITFHASRVTAATFVQTCYHLNTLLTE